MGRLRRENGRTPRTRVSPAGGSKSVRHHGLAIGDARLRCWDPGAAPLLWWR